MRKRLIWISVFVVVLAAIALRVMKTGGQEVARSIEEIHAAEGVPVDVVTVRRGTIRVAREIVGEVAGFRQSVLRATGDYKIDEVVVREGDRVRRGQVLVRYDVDTAPDNVARLAQVREAYDNAKRHFDRVEALRRQGAVSESDLDAARTQLAIAAADLRDARLELEVVSPIDGVAGMIAVSRGDAVVSGDLVAQVVVLDSVRVEAEVPAETARELKAGAAVRMGSDAAGRITRVALAPDPDTRLFRVEATMDNRGHSLQPGVIVTLDVTVNEVGPVAVLPLAAVLGAAAPTPGATCDVFVVRDGVARRLAVGIGEVTEDELEARSGLEDGDRVVVFGANRLSDGTKVRLHRVDGERISSADSADVDADGGGER